MRLYRVAPRQYLEVYNGLGGSYEDGGRWNSPGYPAMYCALSAGGALLEMANYVASPTRVPPSYRLGVYELHDEAACTWLDKCQLPANWSTFPYPRDTQMIGDAWTDRREGVALIVPSVAAPMGLESIALINPDHPDIKHLACIDSTSELYNSRMFS